MGIFDMPIECEHRSESNCNLVNELANATVWISDKTCEACLASDNPKAKNKITCGVAISHLLYHQLEVPDHLLKHVEITLPLEKGPGTELKKLIAWFGIKPSIEKKKGRRCRCSEHIQQMNKWGPDKCLKRMDTILRWLKRSAAIAGVPYVRPAVQIVVRRAINRSRSQSQQPQEETAP